MKLQFTLLLSASLFAVACGSSKKIQSTSNGSGSPSTSTPAPTGKEVTYPMYDESTFQLTGISDDGTYGYTAENAIKVGNGVNPYQGGAANERRFLNALLGPNGESISYYRKGSCCPTPSQYNQFGSALLDRYEVTYEGLQKPIILYINMYDPGDDLKAPKGFTFRK